MLSQKLYRFSLFCFSMMVLFCINAQAQTVRMHSHNDYTRTLPFWEAASQGAYSIEVDLIEKDGKLFVAHDREDIKEELTFTNLYLKAIDSYFNSLDAAGKKQTAAFQLLIDLKTDYKTSLPLVEKAIENGYKAWFDGSEKYHIEAVISGDIPPASAFDAFADYIHYDGRFNRKYTPEQLSKVAMMSASYGDYSVWNGKGRFTHEDLANIQAVMKQAKEMHKPLRLWGAPDSKSAWHTFVKMGFDYINTDQPAKLNEWFKDSREAYYDGSLATHNIYEVKNTFGNKKKPKNIILCIGDGMGLAQLASGITANRGKLNITQLKDMGLSLTHSADDYTTDSAAGGSAMATGSKTNNRAIGVDSNLEPKESILTELSKKEYKTALLSTDAITGATPSSFYAHVKDRGMSDKIWTDYTTSAVDIAITNGPNNAKAASTQVVKDFNTSISYDASQKLLVIPSAQQQKAIYEGGQSWQPQALKWTFDKLSAVDKNKGVFIMIEGARIDYGGHANNTPFLVGEMLDFDKVVGEALKIADQDKETLVIITADHETGGFSLPHGDVNTGEVYGYYYSHDHTGIPVPVFAYGPGSDVFQGTYQNNEIYHKIKQLLK